MNLRTRYLAAALAAALTVPAVQAEPFTFQGVLEQAGTPIHGSSDLRFRLFTAASGGSQLGATFDALAWPVADGVVTIDLDFPGIAFDGSPRWLEIETDGIVLSPRIEVLPAPLAASTNALRGRSISSAAPSAGQVLKWNGSQWTPANESTGGSYSAGTGLDLSGDVFSIVPDYRLPQGCSVDQIPKWSGSAWICQADAGTSYSAGPGLSLSGTTFSVEFEGSGTASTAARSNHHHLGQSWSGSGAHGLTVASSDSFTALRGFNNNAGAGSAVAIHGEATDSAQGVGVLGIGAARGVEGRAASTASDGVYGVNNLAAGTGAGVRGTAVAAAGRGVLGQATSSSGFNAGVRGESASGIGTGVEGASTASAGGTGVRGVNSNGDGYGVVAMNLSGSGAAVALAATSPSPDAVVVRAQASSGSGVTTAIEGVAASSSGTGVRGEGFIGVRGHASAGVGVHGNGTTGMLAEGVQTGLWATVSGAGATAIDADATPASGNAIGVRARSAAAGGAALRAENSAASGTANAIYAATQATSGDTLTVEANGAGSSWAIRARSAGVGGRGLSAELSNPATSGIAVYGQVNSNSARAAQFVNLAPGGEAARFDGNVNVVGTVAKLGGSFRIDHPLDPENRYLYHSFVESPDMMNLYNGNLVTDDRGFATVDLPDWFQALNGDFRYQLTVIGSFAQAIIAEEVIDNRFVVQTSQPRVKVSWQVSGIRHDPWARDNRIEVEVDKPGAERGLYLYPQGYAQPASKRIGRNDDDKPAGGA